MMYGTSSWRTAGKGISTCTFASSPEENGGKAHTISKTDRAVLKIREHPLDDRLNILLKRGLYLAAFHIAKVETGSSPMIGRSGTTTVVSLITLEALC